MKLASWTTIGTPFYRFNGTLKLTDEQIFTYSVPLSFIFALLVIMVFKSYDVNNKWIFMGIYVGIYQIVSKYLEGKSIQYRLNRVNSYFEKKWFGIYSKNDEAISGLKNVMYFNFKYSKKKFPSFDGDSDPLTLITKIIATISYNIMPKKMMFSLISNKIRNITLGIDKAFYSVFDVTFKPTDNSSVQEMPDWIDNDLYKVVINDNITKIHSLRNLINVNRADLFETLNRLEESQKPLLIHSHYFQHDAIIEAIANHIANRIKQFKVENSR